MSRQAWISVSVWVVIVSLVMGASVAMRQTRRVADCGKLMRVEDIDKYYAHQCDTVFGPR